MDNSYVIDRAPGVANWPRPFRKLGIDTRFIWRFNMRQLFLLLSVLLLGLSWAIAQDSTSQSTQGSTSSGQTQGSTSAGQTGGSQGSTTSGQSGSTSGSQGSDTMGNSGQTSRSGSGHMSVEGCLSGSSGNFTLTDKNGMAYQLTGDTAKLSEHVGHEVKVTGTSGSAGAGASGSTETSASGTGSAGAGQTLQVTSVKHVSKTCKSGGAGSGMSH